MTCCAAYIRTSTTKQTTGSQNQRGAIREWFAGRIIADWDEYADAPQPGLTTSRGLRELLDTVRDHHYDDVAMTEISRLGPLFVHS